MLLLSLFAGVALVLATIGVYGVTAYLVSQTTREIGIRIALGATEQAVVRMILRPGLAVCLVGMGLGLAGALAATRFMQRLLFGVQGADPATFAAVFIGLAAIALAACYVPARRAARVDATISLRAE
jgi:ABC-type antimicrobial peptide transport system permease subunit